MNTQAIDLTEKEIDLRNRVEDLNQMVLAGKILEAHDKHYADDVIQQENELEPTAGKVANREREEAFLSNVTEFRGAEVKSVAVDAANDTTMVEWYFDYDHREWGTRRYHQVAVQRWHNGQVVHERFYYGT
jgi:hypothetical protein